MELECWQGWSPGKEAVQSRSFEDLAVDYLKAKQPGRAHLDGIKALRGYFAGMELNGLGKQDVANYITWRRPRNKRFPDRPVSDTTMRRELGVFSAMINHANEAWDWDLPNPIMGRRPKANKHRVRWAHPEQAKRLIHAAQQQRLTPWLADFIELGLNTGMRKMEMLRCELARVDLLNRCIHLYPEHQKSGCYSVVPLNRNARRVILRRLTWIKEHCPDTPWLFPSRMGQGKQPMTDVRKPFTQACQKVELLDFRPHDLRHTFASWLVQAGVPLSELKEAMRHADIKQTEKYAHLRNDTAQRVVEVLDQDLTHSETHREKSAFEEVGMVEEILAKSAS